MTYDMPMFNLGAVVEKTGVQAHTLRAWERRYSLPMPQRSEGGQRLYSQRDVDTICWLVSRQDEGLTISRAVELWKRLNALGRYPLAEPPSPHVSGVAVADGDTVGALRQAWVEACLDFDQVRAEQIVVGAFARLDPEVVVLGILQQGLSQIGELWYAGQASVQQEHFATELAVRRVEALISASPPPSRRELIVTASPPEELHSFGLLLVSLLLRRQGWNVIHLGAAVPLSQVEQTLEQQRPAMVISAAQQLATAATLLEMASLLHEQGVKLAYGGWVFNHIPQLQRRIPGYFLGEHLESVPERVETLLGMPLPPAAEPLSAERVRALAHFHAQRPFIEADVQRLLQGPGMRGEHMAVALQQLPGHIAAALRLGELSYVDPCLDWIAGLLDNLGLPDDLLRRYLEVYRQAASRYLDGRGEPILAWLSGHLNQVAGEES